MERELYALTQEQLLAVCQMVKPLPLTEFVEAIERALNLGPIMDPTLFMLASGNLTKLGQVATAALRFQNVLLSIGQ